MKSQDPFDLFYKTNKNRLFSYLLRITGDYHNAMDIMQEAFARYFSRYRDRENSKGLLYVIAKNTALDSFRKKKETASSSQIQALYHHTPEQEVVSKQNISQIQNAIEELESLDQELIRLVSLKRMTYREIGKRLNLSEGNVKVKVHRARIRLKTILEEEA